MRKNKFLFFISILGAFVFSSTQGFTQETGASENDLENSFSLQKRTDRYALLEDDFDDIPRRLTRYDYFKEEAEKLRLFSRPAGPEFAIFNLQWRRGSLFINDMEIVPGRMQKRKWLAPDGTGDFFYRLFSDRSLLLQEVRMDIQPVLYFDSIDEQTGGLGGGALQRREFDFTLKVPLPEKSAQKIIFYRRAAGDALRRRRTTAPDATDAEDAGQDMQIGEAEF